jgi:hypothetical protein
MGIRNLSSLESAVSRPGLHLVLRREAEIPMPLSETPVPRREGLGCARGILAAIAFQTAVLILGGALWKLHSLFH